MRAIHYFLTGLAVAAALALSIALIVRNLPAEAPVPQQQETASPGAKTDLPPPPEMIVTAAPPAETAPPAAEAAAPPIVTVPPPAVTTSLSGTTKPADPFDPESLPSPGYFGPGRPGVTPPQAAAGSERPASESRGVPVGSRLNLTTEQSDKLRHVLLTHTIMQSEAPEFPLRIGGSVPPEVSLMPLPREVADAIPGYMNYSYVIAQYQIVIVVTKRREIDLLIPTG